MRLRDPEILAGALVNGLLVFLAVPVLLIGSGALEVPLPAWLALYTVMLVSTTLSQWFTELLPRAVGLACLATMVASNVAVVATAPRLGYVAITAVVSVAVCAYYLPRPVVRGVAVLNTVVIVASQAAIGADATTLVFSGVLYLVLQLATVMGIDSQLREERTRQEMAATNADLRATRALLEESTRSKERLRIARELHDVVGHQLTGLILELEIASHQATGASRDHVLKARGIARDLMGDVRSAVSTQRELAPDLRAALEQLTCDVPGLQVHLSVDDGALPDADALTALVRGTQEIVTNTLRHAQARNLWIDVTVDEDDLRLTAQDDGLGARGYRPGNGLRGMHERAEELGGRLEVETSDGFRVRLAVPAGDPS